MTCCLSFYVSRVYGALGVFWVKKLKRLSGFRIDSKPQTPWTLQTTSVSFLMVTFISKGA